MKIRLCWHCARSSFLAFLSSVQAVLLLVETLLTPTLSTTSSKCNDDDDDGIDHSSGLEFDINLKCFSYSSTGQKHSLQTAVLRKGKSALMLPSSLSLGQYDLMLLPLASRIQMVLNRPWNLSLCKTTLPAPIASLLNLIHGQSSSSTGPCTLACLPIYSGMLPSGKESLICVTAESIGEDDGLSRLFKAINRALICNSQLDRAQIGEMCTDSFQGHVNGLAKDRDGFLAHLDALHSAYPVVELRYANIESAGREVAAVERVRMVNALGEERNGMATVIARFGELGTPDEYKLVSYHEVYRRL